MIETPKLDIVPYEKKDAEGNLISVRKSGGIYLTIPALKARKIGQLLLHKGRLVFHKDVKHEEHYFRKHRAWGFHHAVLELDDNVVLRVFSENEKYAITVEEARKVAIKGQYADFERQVFIPLDAFKKASDKPAVVVEAKNESFLSI